LDPKEFRLDTSPQTAMNTKFSALALLVVVLVLVQADNMENYRKRKSKEFLEKNAQKEGVKVTSSGLQYKVLSKGHGKQSPTKSDTVKVHYRGTLIDGKQFDSSIERGTPAEFGVGQVIAGWTEGLQLMNVGDKFEFYIPAELGYGPSGAGGDIPGHSTLIFLVELLGITQSEL